MAIRLPFALQFALLVTLSIFWVLWRMVNQPIAVVPDKPAYPIEYAPITPPDPTPISGTIEPPPPPPSVVGRLDPVSPIAVPVDPNAVRGTTIGTWTGPTRIDPGDIGGTGTDREPVPVVRVSAIYPPGLAARGVEGWVVVEFTITAGGGVRDPRIVDAKPARGFDSAALAAVQRWRYNPRVNDGREVETPGVRTLIRFDLENK